MSKSVEDIVDFYLRKRIAENSASVVLVPTSLRIPEKLKADIDVLAHFLGVSKNSLMSDLLAASVEQGLQVLRQAEIRVESYGVAGHIPSASVDEARQSSFDAIEAAATPLYSIEADFYAAIETLNAPNQEELTQQLHLLAVQSSLEKKS
jgi:hypothetical protein